jgi:hypothetical protein
MTSGTEQDLHGVWGTSPENVYAAGSEGTLLHFDGTRWQEASLPGAELGGLNRVWAGPHSDVVVVGEGGVVIRGRR